MSTSICFKLFKQIKSRKRYPVSYAIPEATSVTHSSKYEQENKLENSLIEISNLHFILVNNFFFIKQKF